MLLIALTLQHLHDIAMGGLINSREPTLWQALDRTCDRDVTQPRVYIRVAVDDENHHF
jgi:hypothetical protein